MPTNKLSQQLEKACDRVDSVMGTVHAKTSEKPEILQETLEELQNAVEELRVAEEELSQQNEELAVARDALEAERERYLELFEFAPDGYLVTDAQGRIQEANRVAADLLNTQQNFLIGKLLINYIEDLQRAEFRKFLFQLTSGEVRSSEWEVQVRPRAYEPFTASVVVGTVQDPAGNTSHLRWMLRNISTRKQAERLLRQQTIALTNALSVLASTLELKPFIVRVLSAIAGALHANAIVCWFNIEDMESAIPYTIYTEGKALEAPYGGSMAEQLSLLSRESDLWQKLAAQCAPIAISNVARDSGLRDPGAFVGQGVRSLMLVPLLSGAKLLGAFTIHCAEPRHFSPEALEFAQGLAQHVTLAMQMTEMAHQGQHAAVLRERNRIAQEIHDTLAQGFVGIGLQLESVEETLYDAPQQAQTHINRARQLARECLAEARRSVHALRPQELHDANLPGAFVRVVERLKDSADVTFQLQGTPFPLGTEVERDLLRIGQEAVTNALKHAHAKHITIELIYEAGQVQLRVRDDGQGFDADAEPGTGMGIRGMYERAERIGAKWNVHSRPGSGTEVTVVIPITPRDEERVHVD